MDKNKKYRWLLIGILTLAFVMIIVMTWNFTSQTSETSNSQSKLIAKYIENKMANYFVINPNDYFWRVNMNELVRKGAHFAEYLLLGFVACILWNVVFRRVWLAMITSLVMCSVYAYIDEFRQNFFLGRSPRWFDWWIDVYGVIVGVLMVTVVFLVLRYIQKIKR